MKQLDGKCIDSFKGIGILGVVLVHYGLNTSNELLGGVVANGARGVQLLFVVNAFLIFNSLDKIEIIRKESVIVWWKKKFMRLIPMYYLFTFLSVLLRTSNKYWLGPLPKISWLNVLCNLLFLHGFYPYYTNSINANWFMGVLGAFYLLAPFLFKMINSLEKALFALLVVTPIGYLLRHVLLQMNVLAVPGIWNDYVNIISFPAELPVILLGILAYYINKEIKKRDGVRNKRQLSYALTLFSLFCMLSLIKGGEKYFFFFNNIFSFGMLFMIMFIAQLIYPIRPIKNCVFEFVGKHSYGIYLSHLIIMKYVDGVLEKFRGNPILDVAGYFVILGLSILIAIIAEKIVKR